MRTGSLSDLSLCRNIKQQIRHLVATLRAISRSISSYKFQILSNCIAQKGEVRLLCSEFWFFYQTILHLVGCPPTYTHLDGSWSELLYNDKATVRYVQSPLWRQSDLWVMSHLWRLMDFPLALLPQLSGEKAGLIRWFICTFPPPVMDGTSTFPWNFIISQLHPLSHEEVRGKWNRHATQEEKNENRQTR